MINVFGGAFSIGYLSMEPDKCKSSHFVFVYLFSFYPVKSENIIELHLSYAVLYIKINYKVFFVILFPLTF